MSKRLKCYCTFLILTAALSVEAQLQYKSLLDIDHRIQIRTPLFYNQNQTNTPKQNQKGIDLSVHTFNPKELPVFCKFEYKIQQKSKVNIRMRLGSLDYVNYLEGK